MMYFSFKATDCSANADAPLPTRGEWGSKTQGQKARRGITRPAQPSRTRGGDEVGDTLCLA